MTVLAYFTHAVSLVSTGTFRGFLVQARTTDGDMVGQFSLVDGEEDVRLSSCTPSSVSDNFSWGKCTLLSL